jgi:ribosomal-protein-alanine N-acetyltransferase
MDKPFIRKMSEQDLPAVMSIEQASFPNPWSLSSFQSELRENDFAHYHSLILQGEVIGYMGYWVIYDEAHITNLAISPRHRGRGWGEYLLRAVMYYCTRAGIARMTLEARVSNDIALRMYQKLGFATVGVRPGYYSDNQEDALIMWATL